MTTYYLAISPQTAELYHHGVKGMKWGVRKERDRQAAYARGERYSGAQGRAFVKREKLADKMEKAKSSGNMKKYASLYRKREKADYKYERAREYKNWGKSALTDGQRFKAAVSAGGAAVAKALVSKTAIGSGASLALGAASTIPLVQAGSTAAAYGLLAMGGASIGLGALGVGLGVGAVRSGYRGIRTATSKKPTVDVNVKSRR